MRKSAVHGHINNERVSIRRVGNGFISVQFGDPVTRVYSLKTWRKFVAKVDAMIAKLVI
ncbi:MAG: hypothetical protein Q7R84_01150 [bacterium]|nr:hypothetical protein [bacterium]